MTNLNLSQECKDGLILENSTNVTHYIDRLKDNIHRIIQKIHMNNLRKFDTHSWITILSELEIERTFLSLTKIYLTKDLRRHHY